MSKRLVDSLADDNSVAGNIRKRRNSLESGDTTTGRPVVGGDSGLDAMGDAVDNRPSQVLKRGFYKENE
jgi:hypothetical protein